MAKKITKAEAMAEFKEGWNEAVKMNPQLRGDSIAKREDWSNYTDMLQREGRITSYQCDHWTNPF